MIKDFVKELSISNSKLILLIIMALTVLFFFSQSALPPDLSSAESDAAAGVLDQIISSDTLIGKFVHDNIRKIGHFTEYGVFGVEMAIFLWLFTKKNACTFARAASVALFIAFCDETVQIFSGRGPAITDVWIDFFGFFAIGTLAFFIIWLVQKIKRKNK